MSNNIDPYSALVGLIRKEGAAYNAPGIDIGTMLPGNKISLGGALISKDIYKLGDVQLSSGDSIAVQRIGELNLILGKVVPL